MAMTDGTDQPQDRTNAAGQPGDDTGNVSPATGRFFQPADWLSFGLACVVVLAVYLCTLAPEVTLEFSGLVSTSAHYAAVAHPPGFPVWTLYSWLFVKLLPFSNVAWRVAVGSAVAAALACGFSALMVSRGGGMLLETRRTFTTLTAVEQTLLRVVCGFAAGLALGFSQSLWRIAVVAEVWALSVLLFAVLLCLLLRWASGPQRRRFLYAAIFIFGLLLTSNQELLVMTPALLLVVVLSDRALGRDLSVVVCLLAMAAWALRGLGLAQWPGADILLDLGLPAAFLLVGVVGVVAIVQTRCFGSEWKSASGCALVLLLGLGWYFYLPMASMTNPPVNWAYSRTAVGFIHLVTRGQYPPYHPTGEAGRFLGQLWALGRETGKGFGWPYLVFAAVPFGFLRGTAPRARAWLLGLTAVFICVGPLLVALLNPAADLGGTESASPYFMPMDVILALWTGLGLLVVGSVVARPWMGTRPIAQPGS